MSFEDIPGMDIDWNTKLDEKLDSAVSSLIRVAESADTVYQYKQKDLTQKVNDEETLEEYIRDTESTFNLERKELKELSDVELNDYVKYLDTLW